MPNRKGRPQGSRNVRPSQKAVQAYYRLLQDKAGEGDTQAAGWLLQLDLLNQQTKEPDNA